MKPININDAPMNRSPMFFSLKKRYPYNTPIIRLILFTDMTYATLARLIAIIWETTIRE
jgi:hypothetical protein